MRATRQTSRVLRRFPSCERISQSARATDKALTQKFPAPSARYSVSGTMYRMKNARAAVFL